MSKLKVGVLGATGLVGQLMVYYLSRHPWFEVVYLGASKASAGRKLREVIQEKYAPKPIPDEVSDLTVEEIVPEKIPKELDIVFSALPPNVAKDIEIELVKRGFTVVSNASPYRLDPDIPLINPEVNLDHLELLKLQERNRGWRGKLVKNPNCTAAILTLALKPILDHFGIKRVIVATMQSVSGAGYPGVPSLDIIDNIVPYIPNEEEKVENESRKILGKLAGGGIEWANIRISATCTRVPVLEGHLETVFVETEKDCSIEEVTKVLKEFRGPPQEMKLPTAPEKPIVVRYEVNRPQPRLDRWIYEGMAVVVGRIRKENAFEKGVKFVLLGHNLARGAAGIAILIAEAMVKLGYI